VATRTIGVDSGSAAEAVGNEDGAAVNVGGGGLGIAGRGEPVAAQPTVALTATMMAPTDDKRGITDYVFDKGLSGLVC
jgi:hypothetical protein